ncbi:hypothetical protein HYQ46_000817 [Verticillium longisporum]|nr:hypothetical protein HYQ46_000817 [Verticillium longisporum]
MLILEFPASIPRGPSTQSSPRQANGGFLELTLLRLALTGRASSVQLSLPRGGGALLTCHQAPEIRLCDDARVASGQQRTNTGSTCIFMTHNAGCGAGRLAPRQVSSRQPLVIGLATSGNLPCSLNFLPARPAAAQAAAQATADSRGASGALLWPILQRWTPLLHWSRNPGGNLHFRETPPGWFS